MSEFIANSGAKVKINIAPFRDAMALKNAIQKEFSKTSVTLSTDFKLDDIFGGDIDFVGLTKMVMAIDSSDDVFDAIFACLIRCTYNGEKITENTFESAEAREDYYQIIFECLKVNFQPFIKGLASRLSGMAKNIMKPDTQK